METNLDAFAKDYPGWTQERLNQYYATIEKEAEKSGMKSAKALHEATARINATSKKAIDDAIVIRNQMKRGFRKEPERLLSLLQLFGFSKKRWIKARNGNQSALLSLLQTFNSNMDATLLEELKAHGVVEHRIISMRGLGRELMAANVEQEMLKSEAPVITSDQIVRLNEIYDTAIDICDAGKTVFKNIPSRKIMFSFKRLVEQQIAAEKQELEDEGNEGDSESNSIE
jgi:hypothetical protein